MKASIKTFVLIIALTFMGAMAKAQCFTNFTLSRPSNSVIAFANTSTPQIPESKGEISSQRFMKN